MAFVPEAALIALREGLEAFLITGILVGLVMKLGRPDARRWVWFGFGAGVAASIAVGLLVQVFLFSQFEEGGGAEWFELVAALAAVGVLTYMVFWMWQHTRTLVVGLREKVQAALTSNTLWLIAFLTFASVLREGLEVVLFYGALAANNAPFDLVWSGLLGVVLSAVLVALILGTTIRFDLAKFFAYTGILLVFVAAGLLVHSVHAAADLGLLPHQDALWDSSGAIPDDRADGRVLHAVLGYTAQPTLLQALLYFGYLFGVGLTYLWHLGAFHARPEKRLRIGRAVAAALIILLALSATAIGAVNPVRIPDDHGHEGTDAHGTQDLFAQARAVLEKHEGKVGLLVRDHGEIVEYNATTFQSVKAFIQHIWPFTGLPPELLLVDDGSYFLDAAHPHATTPSADVKLIDAWVRPWALPAIPVTDPAGTGALDTFGGQYYFTPGTGPGMGEGDLYEIFGLGTYRDWIKMENHSPRYEEGSPVWTWLRSEVQKQWGDRVVVAFAHGTDPMVRSDETIEFAARTLADAKVTVVLDAYQSSVHSDSMNRCMMGPHAEHALRAAGYTGPIVAVGQSGHAPQWAQATADEAARLLATVPAGEAVALHLVHHGAKPGSKNPCGTDLDSYHTNAQREYELAEAAVKAKLTDRPELVVRMVYGQSAGAPDDGVLGPIEALDADRAAGIRRSVLLPYEVWGNGVDTLVYLRESLGFVPEKAPYYDAARETHFTHQGSSVRVASAAFGLDLRGQALLVQVAHAIVGLDASTSGEPGHGHVPIGDAHHYLAGSTRASRGAWIS